MGTKVSTVAERAGVTCPKDTGEMDDSEPCIKCEHFEKCRAALSEFVVGDN